MDASDIRESMVDIMRAALDVSDLIDSIKPALQRQIASVALSQLGIELEEGEITRESLGRAIGSKIEAESGIHVGNIFDRDEVRQALERAACARVVSELGGGHAATPEGVGLALASMARREVVEAVEAGSGPVFDAMYTSAAEVAAATSEAVRSEDYQRITNFTEAGASNRRRQEKFRQTHRRVWQ